ncbi:MAG: GMC family oxidoreductase, partial [Acidobacteriota bacterium]
MRDILIIGSGAGGGPLALTLSEAGFDVLVLEKGPEYQREDYTADEVDNFWSGRFVPPLDEEPHMLVHADLAAPRPTHLGWTACCVGGGTVHMGAYFSRFHPDDFRMATRFGAHQEIADWPYTYDELEPYYSRAEWAVGVSGVAGLNPVEGPRSRPYPLPPLDTHPVGHRLDDACRRLRRVAFPTPRGINSRPYASRPTCRYCSVCASYGCRYGARGSSQEALLTRAVANGRCEVRSPAMAHLITTRRDGRVDGCLYYDTAGREHLVQARVVCVCCSSIESARLLLLSQSALFPDGLANSNGRVGRHLQFHGTSIGQGCFRPDRRPELFVDGGSPFLGRTLGDHYFLPEGVGDLPKGGLIVFQKSRTGPISLAKSIAQRDQPTAWGSALKQHLRRRDRNDVESLFFEVHHDFLPNAETFIELDPEVRDRWGLPVARIHLHESPHQEQAGRYLVDRGLEVFDEMGADTVLPVAIGETAPYLVHGTCRAGHDPATSVVDATCRTHEV